jgi:hypothetical protein
MTITIGTFQELKHFKELSGEGVSVLSVGIMTT